MLRLERLGKEVKMRLIPQQSNVAIAASIYHWLKEKKIFKFIDKLACMTSRGRECRINASMASRPFAYIGDHSRLWLGNNQLPFHSIVFKSKSRREQFSLKP